MKELLLLHLNINLLFGDSLMIIISFLYLIDQYFAGHIQHLEVNQRKFLIVMLTLCKRKSLMQVWIKSKNIYIFLDNHQKKMEIYKVKFNFFLLIDLQHNLSKHIKWLLFHGQLVAILNHPHYWLLEIKFQEQELEILERYLILYLILFFYYKVSDEYC